MKMFYAAPQLLLRVNEKEKRARKSHIVNKRPHSLYHELHRPALLLCVTTIFHSCLLKLAYMRKGSQKGSERQKPEHNNSYVLVIHSCRGLRHEFVILCMLQADLGPFPMRDRDGRWFRLETTLFGDDPLTSMYEKTHKL